MNHFSRHLILAILLSPFAMKSYSEPTINSPASNAEELATLLEFIGSWHAESEHEDETKKWLDPLSFEAINHDQTISKQQDTKSTQPEELEAITDE